MHTQSNLKKFEGRIGYQVIVDRYCKSSRNVVDIPERKTKKWQDYMPDWQHDSDGEYRNRYFYKGDLQGLISKLDYIKELGVGLLILGPISKTNEYHHYDVGDQRVIDPYIGTEEEFEELCKEAHKRDILIGVDLVFNHMGYDSEIFQKALQGDGKYRNWFFFNQFGSYRYWYDFKNMPICNQLNHDYQEYVCSVVAFYVKNGADMIRLDLGEILQGELIEKIIQTARSINPEVLVINERWEFANRNDNYDSYFDVSDSIMNYPAIDAIVLWLLDQNEKHFQYNMDRISHYPAEKMNLLWNPFGSHDIPRIINLLHGDGVNHNPFEGRSWDLEKPWRFSDGFDTYGFRKWESEHSYIQFEELTKRKLLLASVIQYTLPGIPVIFYGTEVGMCGLKDPFCRCPYPWGREDLELRQHFIDLGRMKCQNKDVLASGRWYYQATPNFLQMVRTSEAGTIVTMVNNSENEIETDIPNGKVVFSVGKSNASKIAPFGAIIYRT